MINDRSSELHLHCKNRASKVRDLANVGDNTERSPSMKRHFHIAANPMPSREDRDAGCCALRGDHARLDGFIPRD